MKTEIFDSHSVMSSRMPRSFHHVTQSGCWLSVVSENTTAASARGASAASAKIVAEIVVSVAFIECPFSPAAFRG